MALHVVGRPEAPITDLRSVSAAIGDLLGNDGFWELPADPRTGIPDTREVADRTNRTMDLVEKIALSLGNDINCRNIRHLGEALRFSTTSKLVREFFEDMARCREIAQEIRTTGRRYRSDSLHPLRDHLKHMKLMADTVNDFLELIRERSASAGADALAAHTRQNAALALLAANQSSA